eukprot:m.466992 g.466992  ORF g.466992 m.466992 type:complete len:970 (-) comp25806_c0_seq1:118-3027(-)
MISNSVPRPAWWRRACSAALGGGVPGAAAMVLNVLLLMWLRTTVNYQFRTGYTTLEAMSRLYAEGGVARFYSGLPYALLQASLARFGDTAAYQGVTEAMVGRGASQFLVTLLAAAAAGLWRVLITPIDVMKTTLQVGGSVGWDALWIAVTTHGVLHLFRGVSGTLLASVVSYYPWFTTYKVLNTRVAPQRGAAKHVRSAAIGLGCSLVSDLSTNWIRCIKTITQTSDMGYIASARSVLEQQGVSGLLIRGLPLKLLSNGIQAIMFTVLWRYFMEKYNRNSTGMTRRESVGDESARPIEGDAKSRSGHRRWCTSLRSLLVSIGVYFFALLVIISRGGGPAASVARPSPHAAGPSVLVIGSGPSGLAMLRELGEQGAEPLWGGIHTPGSIRVACYDKQWSEGGQWTGNRSHSAMYSGMWINAPHWNTEYPSYTVAEHFGREVGPFYPRAVALDYVDGYVRRNRLTRFVQHGVEVTGVAFDPTRQVFEVTSREVEGGGLPRPTETYDYVVMATGIFHTPNEMFWPDFVGEQVHAMHWQGPSSYAGKTVVIVGWGDSAQDIAALLMKAKATVYASIRSIHKKGFPEKAVEGNNFCEAQPEANICDPYGGINLRGGITSAVGRAVQFDAGKGVDADAIIYATGYKPQAAVEILDPSLRLEIKGGSVAASVHSSLYYQLFFNPNPRLMYLGYNYAVFTFAEFEYKAALGAAVVAGRVKIPGMTERSLQIKEHKEMMQHVAEHYHKTNPVTCDVAYDFCDNYPDYALAQLNQFVPIMKAAGTSQSRLSAVLEHAMRSADYTIYDDYVNDWASSCSCDNSTFLDKFARYRDTGPSVRHSGYMEVFDDSKECFFDRSQCKTPSYRTATIPALPPTADEARYAELRQRGEVHREGRFWWVLTPHQLQDRLAVLANSSNIPDELAVVREHRASDFIRTRTLRPWRKELADGTLLPELPKLTALYKAEGIYGRPLPKKTTQ